MAQTGIASCYGALTAATAENFSLTGRHDRVELVHISGTDPVYYRNDGTAAAVAADECGVLLPGERLAGQAQFDGDVSTVSLISAGTPTVGITTL